MRLEYMYKRELSAAQNKSNTRLESVMSSKIT
jgi:hypothetical protein